MRQMREDWMWKGRCWWLRPWVWRVVRVLGGRWSCWCLLGAYLHLPICWAVASYTDNILALCRTKKGSSLISVPSAFLLLIQALHQQHYCYHSRTAHIAGTANVMADDCSQLWHLTDEQLLTHFNLHYPQSLLWQQCTLWPEMNFALLSALQREQQPLESFLLQLTKLKHGGSSGWPNVQSGRSTPSKIPVQPTPPTTWQHLPMKYAPERSPLAKNFSGFVAAIF